MASFRILNQAPQYLLPSGKVNAGGSLTFYETDLTTLKNTWSDPDLTVLNANPVVMDAAGRTLTDVWGDGEYGVVMADALGAVIWTRNNVKAGDDTGATALPVLGVGQFITSDGSTLIATDIIQVPDPTGQEGDILYSDGVLPYWAPPPVIPEPEVPTVVIVAGSTKLGDDSGSNFELTQYGTGTAPAAPAAKATSVAVTFAQAYSTTPVVMVTPTGGPFTNGAGAGGYFADVSVTASSPTGFTVTFNTDHGEANADGNIISAINFGWLAIGRTTT